jgi:hypothetical protein
VATRARRTLIDTLGRRRRTFGCVWKARERRAGESLLQVSAVDPGRGETQGSIQRLDVLTRRRSPGTLARVKAQEPRPAGPARRSGDGSNGRRNGKWVHPAGNGRVPRGRRKLRRVNPKSVAGVR